jgi:hypothetical protein
MRKIILAREVVPGTIMDKSLDSEVFTVRQAYLAPATGTMNGQEMVIRGPLGIVIKRDADAKVSVLV